MTNNTILKTCPIEITLELITKKWVVQIIRDMLFGKSRFSEFKENNPQISNKALSRCLKQMEKDELIIKNINPENIRDTEYKLTEKGTRLNKIIYELANYAIDDDNCIKTLGTEDKKKTKELCKKKLKINKNSL